MRKYRLPILGLLPAFEATARHRSMQKAALEMSLSRQAISQQIVKLEQQVGRAVFKRLPNRLILTAGGETLLSAVDVAFSHIQRAVRQMNGRQKPERLILSVDPDFASLWLVPRLAEFYASVPDTVVEIVAENDISSQRRPTVHCAIRYAPAGVEFENVELLFRSRLFPVCSAALARTLPVKTVRDLGRHVLLHDRSMREWKEYLDSYGARADVDPRKGIVFSKSALCLEAAVRGQGVAMGDDFLAATYLAEGRLIRPFDSSLRSRNAYYFLVPAGAAKHPAVASFRSWLFSNVGRRRAKVAAV
jgi:LysR family glycine cleavage system transcriptional activator